MASSSSDLPCGFPCVGSSSSDLVGFLFLICWVLLLLLAELESIRLSIFSGLRCLLICFKNMSTNRIVAKTMLNANFFGKTYKFPNC